MHFLGVLMAARGRGEPILVPSPPESPTQHLNAQHNQAADPRQRHKLLQGPAEGGEAALEEGDAGGAPHAPNGAGSSERDQGAGRMRW